MRALRRHPSLTRLGGLLAIALVLLGGVVRHDCRAEAAASPAAEPSPHLAHSHSHSGEHAAPSDQSQPSQDCSCLGECCPSFIIAAAASGPTITWTSPERFATESDREPAMPDRPALRRQPPATAPPRLG